MFFLDLKITSLLEKQLQQQLKILKKKPYQMGFIYRFLTIPNYNSNTDKGKIWSFPPTLQPRLVLLKIRTGNLRNIILGDIFRFETSGP